MCSSDLDWRETQRKMFTRNGPQRVHFRLIGKASQHDVAVASERGGQQGLIGGLEAQVSARHRDEDLLRRGPALLDQ